MTIPQPIPLSGAQFNPPMPQSQSVNPIFQNDPLVIPGIKCKFRQALRKQVMLSAAKKTLFSHLTLPSVQTFHKVLMPQTFLDDAFFHSFGLLLFPDFLILLCQKRIQFRLQGNKFCHHCPATFVFHQPNLFLVFRHNRHSIQHSWMLWGKIICVKPLFHICCNISEEIFCFNLQNQRICVCVQNRNVFSTFSSHIRSEN